MSEGLALKTQKKSDLKSYSQEEVLKSAIDYFKGDTLAGEVWMKKYALKDAMGNLYEKTPDEMHKRISSEFARIEAKYPNPISEQEIYDVIKDFKYIIPQGSPMAGIGNNFQYVSISNCFVIGNEKDEDSYGGILKLDQELVQLMKRRAGVGVDLSFVRPSGSPVQNSALTATGVVPFMERFSNSTREVAQGGRRGALMESIAIDHPDSEAFIDAKTTAGKVTGANVSVKISDDFMKTALTGGDYTLTYPVKSKNPSFTKTVDAKRLWDKIVHNAWTSAEPGILFWDTLISESIPDCYADLGFETVSTNPCGEIPLCPNDSCRLLAINLYSYVNNPFTDEAEFDYELFDKHVILAQRLMDDLIDLELEKVDKIINKIKNDPESESVKTTELNLWTRIREKCEQGRRTGLGITAEGDMLAALNICYGTDESNDFSEALHMRLKHGAFLSSSIMAEERGAFPIWDAKREEENPFMLRIKEENPALYERLVQHGRRNIALLTIAPTGSVSILTQTTSGIEPAFMVSYMRRRKINPDDVGATVDFVDEVGDSWQEYPVFHHKFETYLIAKGYNMEDVRKMDQDQIASIIAKSPYHLATSNDVNWVKKVEMQGRVQKHIDHSISVTVNLPNDVTEEMVGKVYQTAWESGCKGVTVYRDGSRSGVLIATSEKEEVKTTSFDDHHAPERPERLEADVVRFQNNLEEWIAFVGMIDGRPYEIFTGRRDGFNGIPNDVKKGFIKKVKSDDSSRYDFQYEDRGGYNVTVEGLSRSFDKEYWNYAKMISGVLRHGMPLLHVVDLVGSLNLSDDTLNTWKNGISRVVKKYVPDGTESKNECPECHQKSVQFQEGCLTCTNCGHSACG
ncbi:adenosylcobalamin-dependent ribonucleoside-diphosphate reductase [Brumimicrobium glaciale]|jgi:ribonucleoside-diphosphate reductase alpha chain|uniref:Vitamin B12-dependent ribonucleotide reductase n=1 Tax=Brumimicrobium glaciale TaxID=200475 RepID=A0A4Q4KPR0_9FLAO|nr:adenosylcobalamin-dependent ribonucleoside-diphosphate reductase [Brumimicrobium glaciale]RYM35446.1 adenosylcobalamin-dependent ribonucleoside-diphosphate reductase [Brumimicrobium glaciale]